MLAYHFLGEDSCRVLEEGEEPTMTVLAAGVGGVIILARASGDKPKLAAATAGSRRR